MAETGTRRTSVRLAAAVLASLIVAFAVVTYLSYTAAFASIDTVTVSAPRAGLVMEKGAKVKYRGIQIGKVETIDYSGDQARLTLSINSADMPFIPSNATVHIAGNTIFGAKSVEFLPPQNPSPTSLRPDAHVAGLGGAAGSQHLVPVADRPAAQDRPGRTQRDAERAVRRSARSRRRPRRHLVGPEHADAPSEPEAARPAGGLP